MPLMRPNWRRCDALTKRGELCMNRAQLTVGGKLVCRTHADHVTVDDGVIRNGHARVAVALTLGEQTIPVREL